MACVVFVRLSTGSTGSRLFDFEGRGSARLLRGRRRESALGGTWRGALLGRIRLPQKTLLSPSREARRNALISAAPFHQRRFRASKKGPRSRELHLSKRISVGNARLLSKKRAPAVSSKQRNGHLAFHRRRLRSRLCVVVIQRTSQGAPRLRGVGSNVFAIAKPGVSSRLSGNARACCSSAVCVCFSLASKSIAPAFSEESLTSARFHPLPNGLPRCS